MEAPSGARTQVQRSTNGKSPATCRQCYEVLTIFVLVPYTEVFSNQLLDDLDKLWELRYWIPDPTDPKKCVVEVGR